MISMIRPSRPLPIRALAVVACMVGVVAVSQLLAPRNSPSPAADATSPTDPRAPALGDLDGGSEAGTAAVPRDVTRIRENIDFWSTRVRNQPKDFVSATQWGISEIELARATGDVGAYLRAEAAFNAALKSDPTNIAASGYRGSVLVSLHRFSDAAALARRVLERRPDDQVALATLGDASLELGDLAAARDAYSRVNALNPSAAIQARLAHLAFVSGDTATAREAAAAAVIAGEDEGAEGERAAFYHYQQAEVLVSTGDRDGAATAYAAALAADPGSFLARSGLARVAAASGDLDEAIEQLSAAIDIVPQPDLVARRGDLFSLRAAQGDARRAADDYATVEAIAMLAGEAAGVYDRTLANYRADHGLEPDRAVRLAESELKVRKDVYGYDTVAWTLLAAGRATEADAAMATALAFGTRDARLLYHAGMIASALGQSDRARSLLEESLRVDPSFDPLQVARAREIVAGLR